MSNQLGFSTGKGFHSTTTMPHNKVLWSGNSLLSTSASDFSLETSKQNAHIRLLLGIQQYGLIYYDIKFSGESYQTKTIRFYQAFKDSENKLQDVYVSYYTTYNNSSSVITLQSGYSKTVSGVETAFNADVRLYEIVEIIE